MNECGVSLNVNKTTFMNTAVIAGHLISIHECHCSKFSSERHTLGENIKTVYCIYGKTLSDKCNNSLQ